MTLALAVRTLAVLAVVAACTLLLAQTALPGSTHPALNGLLLLAHH